MIGAWAACLGAGKPIDEPEQQRNVLAKGDAAVVDFAPSWPVLVVPREESQVLGSFIIREKDFVVSPKNTLW